MSTMLKGRFARLTCSDVDALAATIARDLFTSGCGSRASRLVMVDKEGRQIAGWCEEAVRDRIAGHLVQPNAQSSATGEKGTQ